jgi:hypothetical protein
MQVTSRFFDTLDWSIYGTLQTMIPLVILRYGDHSSNLKYLVMSSVIVMMDGKLLHRAIYAFFLSLMVWSNTKGFLINTFLTVVSTILTYYIPYPNPVQKYISSEPILRKVVYITIVIWFIIIVYLIKKELYNI